MSDHKGIKFKTLPEKYFETIQTIGNWSKTHLNKSWTQKEMIIIIRKDFLNTEIN